MYIRRSHFSSGVSNKFCMHPSFLLCVLYAPPISVLQYKICECLVMWQQPAGLFSVLVEWVHMAPHRDTCPNKTRTLLFYTHNPVLSTSAHRTPFYIQCTLKWEHLHSTFICLPIYKTVLPETTQYSSSSAFYSGWSGQEQAVVYRHIQMNSSRSNVVKWLVHVLLNNHIHMY
jgi:hypothetical protein